MKYYKVYREEIEEIEVVRATEKSVWRHFFWCKKPVRYNKHSFYENYFETLKEAKEFVLNNYVNELKDLEQRKEAIKRRILELNKL